MAYVGTVCITDREGNPLLTRRYAVPAHAGAATVITRMMKDLRWARQRRPTLNVGVVQDGASELWHRMRAAPLRRVCVQRSPLGCPSLEAPTLA
jgi:hypothetical protein